MLCWRAVRVVTAYFSCVFHSTYSFREIQICCNSEYSLLESSWNVMTRGDAWEGKWRRNWRMEWVASTLHTTSEHGVASITTADVHTSAASTRLNWRSRRFKWTLPFRRKNKSGFCAYAITFHTQSTYSQLLTSVTLISVSFKILQTVNIKTAICWAVTLCSLIYWAFCSDKPIAAIFRVEE